MGQDWKGGDVVRYPGGGHKINLLKPVVEQWKDEKNTVVMFVDRCVCVCVCVCVYVCICVCMCVYVCVV